jgi:hypothetical protein
VLSLMKSRRNRLILFWIGMQSHGEHGGKAGGGEHHLGGGDGL